MAASPLPRTSPMMTRVDAPHGPGDREQVAADLGVVLGGQIQPGHAQRTDLAGRGAQQHALRGLGDRARPHQLPGAPLPYMTHEHDQGGEHHQSDELRDVVGGAESAVQDGDDHLGGDGEQADQGRQPGARERGREGRRDDQQGAQMDVGGGADVHHGDHDDQRERDGHQTAARRLLHETVH